MDEVDGKLWADSHGFHYFERLLRRAMASSKCSMYVTKYIQGGRDFFTLNNTIFNGNFLTLKRKRD